MTPGRSPDDGRRRPWGAPLTLCGVLAAVAYVPLLLTHRGMVGADTKAYLTLDPGRLLARAATLWDPNTGMGTVTHQNIGYLLPMGPWYWLWHQAGVPMWVAQRLWTGTLLAAAGVGMVVLLGTLGWGTWPRGVSASFYMLSPYVAQYEARISAILMPWAALPWLLALTIRSVRSGGWRHPALFALLATAVGGVNATSLILAGIAPVLWIPFAAGVLHEVPWSRALGAAARIGVLTAVTGLWWIAGLAVEAGYGLNVLRYTETVQTVATTGTAVEVARGLGNWFFYGLDAIGAWVQPAVDYTQWGWLLGVTLAVPVLAFASAVVVRWREKLYFAVLLVVGVTLAVGVHPYAHPSPIGAVLKAFAGGSTAGLALRSTGRAVPLVALAVAVFVGAGSAALWERRPRLAKLVAAGLVATAVAGMTPLLIGQFVDDQLQRPEQLPAYWSAAAAYVDAHGAGTRVWEEPGQDFLHYRWGATLDPITPGLIDRPYLDRELVPTGGAGSADLLRAVDERLQEGVLEPGVLAPLARRMSVGDLVLRSDLQWERYRTPRPVETWPVFDPAPAGLRRVATFGPPVGDVSVVPFVDEQALAQAPSPDRPPAVAVFSVTGAEPIVRAEPVSAPIVLAGDGEGMVDASAAGLLEGNNTVLYAGTLDRAAAGYQAALAAGADLVLTDTNRKRAQRYGSIRDTFGYTQEAGEVPLAVDPNNAPLPVFPGTGDDAATVALEGGQGVAVVRASSYGSNVSYDPQARPDLAVDGDPGTAWTVGSFTSAVGQYLRIDFSQPLTAAQITLQQPYTPHVVPPPGEPGISGPVVVPGERWITKVRLHFDRGPDVVRALDDRSRSPSGQAITFPSRTFNWVRITILATSTPAVKVGRPNGVGFSEVRVGGARVDELLRLPTDLLRAVGSSDLAHRLTILMTRLQTNPAEPFTGDPEPSISRTFTLPSTRTFSVGGTAQVSALAPDFLLDPLLGRPNNAGMLAANSSSRLPGDLAARSSSALDGDPTTAWTTARGPQVGNWIRVDLPHPVSLDRIAMQVVADGRHSVPTRLGISVDGGPARTVDLPSIAEGAAPGSTATVPVSLPGTTAHRSVLFRVDAVRAETTLDNLSASQITLPVSIAELGLPGIREAAPATNVPSGCRTDLLSVDGRPVGIRLVGATAVAEARRDLTVQACGAPLVLPAGRHVVRTAAGHDAGIAVDRIVLSSAAGGGADPALGSGGAPVRGTGGAPAPAVTVVHESRTALRVRLTSPVATRTRLVLGESLNRGWQAHVVGGASLGPPQLVDGFANGWQVDVPAGRPVLVTLSWTPQRGVDVALLLSALGVAACLALALAPRRRRSSVRTGGAPSGEDIAGAPDAPHLSVPWARVDPRPGRWAVAAAIAVAGWGLAGVAVGVAVAAVLVPACLWRRGRVLIAGAAVVSIAAAAAAELGVQLARRLPLALEWPSHFETAGHLAWAAVILLLADAILQFASGEKPGDRSRWSPRDP